MTQRETIGQRLDRLFPAYCTCGTPIKRMDKTWHCCPACGIDQTSFEGVSNKRLCNQLLHIGNQMNSVNIALRLSPALRGRLEIAALDEGLPLATMIRELLREALASRLVAHDHREACDQLQPKRDIDSGPHGQLP